MLLKHLICALVVIAALLNGYECRPDPVIGAIGGLANGIPAGAAVSGAVGAVGGLAGGVPVVGGIVGGR